MKKVLLLIFMSFVAFVGYGQVENYPYFIKYFWGDNYDESKKIAAKKLLNTEKGLNYIVEFNEKAKELENLRNEYQEVYDKMENEFNMENSHPDESYERELVDELSEKLISLEKTYNYLTGLAGVAKSAYNICMNNPYSTDCSSQANNYNNLVDRMNNTAYEYERVRIRAENVNDRLNRKIDTYNENLRKHNHKLDSLHDKYSSRDSELVDELNQMIDEINYMIKNEI